MTDSLTTESPQMADGATVGRLVTCSHETPPSFVRKNLRSSVSVPTQPFSRFAKPTQRRYASLTRNCSVQEFPPSAVIKIWPLLFTAQPVDGSINQMSAVLELATGALVARHCRAVVVMSDILLLCGLKRIGRRNVRGGISYSRRSFIQILAPPLI